MRKKTEKFQGSAIVSMLSFLILLTATRARADQIVLENGDRISGEIIHILDMKIQVATEYAGEISIDFAAVADMRTDRSARIFLENGDVITGKIGSLSSGQVSVSSTALGEIEFPRGQFLGLDTRNVEDLKIQKLQDTHPTPENVLSVPSQAEEEKIEEPASVPSLWSGSLSVGGQLQRGNTDTADLRIEVNAKRTAPREELQLRFYSDYGETDGETDTNKVFGQAKLKLFRTERRYVFGVTNMEYDEMENLDLRAQGFGGLGRIFIDKESTNVLGEIGAGLTGEFFDNDGDEETLEASLWLNAEWRQGLFERLEFYQALTLQPSLGDFGDFRLRSESTIAAPLGAGWAIKFSLIDDYDSDPESEDTKKNDLRLISSAEYAF